MAAFVREMNLKEGSRIIDFGGLPDLWEMLELELDVTLVNLPSAFSKADTPLSRRYRFVEADVSEDLPFRDYEFDIAFSNSVIEHVGGEKRQEKFAENLRRVAPSYWVQTPSIWFPLESHCNLPFWWFYPESLKQLWFDRWQRTGYDFLLEQMKSTRVLLPTQLKKLFPDSQVYIESFLGFQKSYCMFRAASY
ncbi:MAG: hypothetical protein OHK0037_12000 [Elainellaceae cyanobacterium]